MIKRILKPEALDIAIQLNSARQRRRGAIE
jgi:hypothetical protein